MEKKWKELLFNGMYVVIWIASSLPVFCGYICEGGEVNVWIGRIEEMGKGILYGQYAPFDSNLWLFLPAVLLKAGVPLGIAYSFFMAAVQLVTLLAAKAMFQRILESPAAVLYAVLFYMTCPCHIYICYDQADWGQAVVWMLLPLLGWGTAGLYQDGWRWRYACAAAIAFGGIGHADCIAFAVLAGILLIAGIWHRKWIGWIPLIAGSLLNITGAGRLMRYLFFEDNWEIPIDPLSSQGYVFGRFLTSFAYQNGRPGFGLGLMGALALFFWLLFTEKCFRLKKEHSFPAAVSAAALLMSLSAFPWDFIGRISGPCQRLASLLDAPSMFFGFACAGLCALAGYAVEGTAKQDKIFVKIGFPAMIYIASIAVAVYLCNMLTYTRMPLT